jgi:hypothetical protein
MMKFGRIAVVSTTALALAATVPTKAEAADLFFPGAYGRVAYGGGGYYGGAITAPAAVALRRLRPAAKSTFRRLRRRAVSMVAVGAAAAIMAPAMAVTMVISLRIKKLRKLKPRNTRRIWTIAPAS